MTKSKLLIASAALAVAGVAAIGSGSPGRVSGKSGLLDYLIQDVCIDTAGRATKGDPAFCARRRDLRIGEATPFLVTDFDPRAGYSLAFFSSIPVRGTDGNLHVLVVKSLEGRFTPNYRFSFSPARDAFDLIDISHSRFASIVRTFDGSCFDQTFASTARGKTMSDRAGGWILFPLDQPTRSWRSGDSIRRTTYRKQVTPAGSQCANNQSFGYTSWQQPALTTFQTGKRLAAIRSDHFAGADLSQSENSFERTYFTREYGMTRWEAWWTLAHCHKAAGAASPRCRAIDPANPAKARCSMPNSPVGIEHWGGQEWVRMDCRDLTNYLPLARPQLILTPEIARGGGLVDVDYAATKRAARRPRSN